MESGSFGTFEVSSILEGVLKEYHGKYFYDNSMSSSKIDISNVDEHGSGNCISLSLHLKNSLEIKLGQQYVVNAHPSWKDIPGNVSSECIMW